MSRPARPATLDERIAASLDALAPAEQRVARWLADHRETVAFRAVREVARDLSVSAATVVRTAQALGYHGIPELKRELAAEILRRGGPLRLDVRAARTFKELPAGSGDVDAIAAFHIRLLDEARTTIERAELRRAVLALDRAERIVVFAYAAYKGLADLFALELKRFGRRAVALGSPPLAEELLDLGPSDALVVIAYSPTATVEAVLERARAVRAPVVLVTDALGLALKGRYTAALVARRGDPARYSTSLMALFTLEALLLSLAAHRRSDTRRALQKLAAISRTLPPL